jgi:hypothetical protein
MSDEKLSWAVKDEAMCDELISILGLTADEIALVKAMEPLAKDHAPAMVKEFHSRLLATENTKQYFEKSDVNHVGKMVGIWFERLFSGNYDAEYAKSRIKIGLVHAHIGLPVRYPLAMLDVIQKAAMMMCDKQPDPAASRLAFYKILSLDVAIFSSAAYEDSQLRKLSELVGSERLARRLLTE